MKPTVLLASRSKTRLKAWVRATEDLYEIIAEVDSATSAEALVLAEKPRLAVLDLALENGSALDFLKSLGDERPLTVVITPSGTNPVLLEVCGAGAVEVLTEPVSGERLREVLELALSEDGQPRAN